MLKHEQQRIMTHTLPKRRMLLMVSGHVLAPAVPQISMQLVQVARRKLKQRLGSVSFHSTMAKPFGSPCARRNAGKQRPGGHSKMGMD